MAVNYTTLVADRATDGSIKNWINYARLPSTTILTEAEAWIYQRLRAMDMLTLNKTVAIASGDDTVSFPTNYRYSLILSIPGYINRIRLREPGEFYSSLGLDTSGLKPSDVPTEMCEMGGVMQLNTRANQAYTAHWAYYAALTALSGANETNFLTDKYPTLLRHVCMMFAYEFRKDKEREAMYAAKAMKAIDDANVHEDERLATLELDFHWRDTS